jgi:protocatechuate 3,4-dioxygenase beta subunit
MVDLKEPGERLIVTGTVTGPDGKTPVRGASVHVFHVDAAGRYSGVGPSRGDDTNPRLRGYMRSDANGHYAYTTIRPAPYIDDIGGAAHVHYEVNAQGYKEQRGQIMYFTDDPQFQSSVNPARSRPGAMRPGFSGACQPTKDASGAWHCTMDIVLASE